MTPVAAIDIRNAPCIGMEVLIALHGSFARALTV